MSRSTSAGAWPHATGRFRGGVVSGEAAPFRGRADRRGASFGMRASSSAIGATSRRARGAAVRPPDRALRRGPRLHGRGHAHAEQSVRTRIEKAIATADVMLVLIGRLGGAGRRLATDDFIRREILAACASSAGSCRCASTAPRCRTLPHWEELRPLVASEGAVLRHGEFLRDANTWPSLPAFVRPSPEASAATCRWRCGSAGRCPGGRACAASPRALLATQQCQRPLRALTVAPQMVARSAEQGTTSRSSGDRQRRQGDRRVLNGTVTDEVDRIVEDAVVTLSNLDASAIARRPRFRRVPTPTRPGGVPPAVAPSWSSQAPLPEVSRELRRQRPPLSPDPAA